MLRAAREKQGLHIAALAASIKVAPRKLDALEHDRWSELPDATFVRALAQSVCRVLKVDPRPVLELLPPASKLGLDPMGVTLNAPFRERPGREDPGLANMAVRPMVLAAAALMVAALAVYLLPEGLWSASPVVASAGLARASGGAASAVAYAASQPPALGSASPEASTAAAASAPVAAAVLAVPLSVASAPLPAASMARPDPTSAVTTPPPARAETPAPPALQLRASQASWVELRDARGQVLLSRVVQAGESLGFEGAPPLRLVVGNVAATQLAYRGQVVDLSSHARDNVARFELQ
jgi:cytoskeleton protein RodZ